MYTETIKEFSGFVIGYLEHLDNGDVIAKKYSGVVLGKYEKASDATKDFSGRILYYGNAASALIILNK